MFQSTSSRRCSWRISIIFSTVPLPYIHARPEQDKCSKDSKTEKSVHLLIALLMVDVAIGLTEGWVAGIARGEKVRIIGSYVQSPLRIHPSVANSGWAISTGPESKYNGISDLKGSAIGVSRIGRWSENEC
jgi:hypothetical protein